jgi:hypothetical protein
MLHTIQNGRQLRYVLGGAGTNTQQLPTVVTGTTSGAATAYPVRAASGATAYMPPIASIGTFIFGGSGTGNAGLSPNSSYGTFGAIGTATASVAVWDPGTSSTAANLVDIELESNSVYYWCNLSGGTGGTVFVYGCELNI